MSYRKVSGIAAITGTVFALAGSAYADTGKSPNGPPGPEGNPNPPAAQPQANGPQGPAGNEQRGKSQAEANKNKAKAKPAPKAKSKSKSDAKPAPKSNSKSKSKSNHANPNPGTPRKGGREDRPAGKITICHATRSETNPYVEITISVNGLNGHGPAADPHHHAGSWKDIIPAPAGGCPDTVQSTPGTTDDTKKQETTTTTPVTGTQTRPDLGLSAPAPESQAVLGAQAEGTTPSKEGEGPQSVVLGASDEGETTPVADAPAEVLAAREAGDDEGSLPFTGFELAFLLALGAAALLGGFALRRATRSSGL